jgi:hypothetical protein
VKLTKLEEALFFSLIVVSMLIVANILIEMTIGITFSFFSQVIHIAFYILALFTPLYMVIQWMKVSTKERFLKIVLALIPAVLFGFFTVVLSTELGYILASF